MSAPLHIEIGTCHCGKPAIVSREPCIEFAGGEIEFFYEHQDGRDQVFLCASCAGPGPWDNYGGKVRP